MKPPTDKTLRLGRGPDCDIVLADASVSRRHAELTIRADGRLWLRDCGSTQGTFLLTPGQAPRALKAGWVGPRDVLRFGQVELRVADLLDPAAARSAKSPAMPAGSVPKVRCACGAVKSRGEPCHVCGHP